MPIGRKSSSSSQIATSWFSRSVRGATHCRPAPLDAASGGGNARRSILPVGPSGRRSHHTIACGIMYSGRRLRRKARIASSLSRPRRPGDDIGNQPARRSRAVDHDDRFLHGGVPTQVGGDLSRLDPEAADLDLVVGAAEQVDRPVSEVAAAVAGAIEPDRPAGLDLRRDEFLGGQSAVVEVAEREAGAAEIDLAGHAHGYGIAAVVQDIDLRVRDRPADGHALRIAREQTHVEGGGERRRFGRAVSVQQGAAEPGAEHGPDGARIGRLAAEHQAAQRQEDLWRGAPTSLNSAVVRNITLMRCAAIRAPRSTGDSSTLCGITTVVAPLSRAPQISSRAASNAGLAPCATTSSARNSMKFVFTTSRAIARCGMTTPLGSPDVPDVNSTQAGSSALPASEANETGLLANASSVPTRSFGPDVQPQRGGGLAVDDDERRLDAIEHCTHPLRRLAGIQRNVGAAGLEDGQHRNDHRRRTLQAQADPQARPRAMPDQLIRPLIGQRVELVVAKLQIVGDHRELVRRPPRLRAEHGLDPDVARKAAGGPVPADDDLLALGRIQQRQRRNAPLRILGRRREDIAQVPPMRRIVSASNRSQS